MLAHRIDDHNTAATPGVAATCSTRAAIRVLALHSVVTGKDTCSAGVLKRVESPLKRLYASQVGTVVLKAYRSRRGLG